MGTKLLSFMRVTGFASCVVLMLTMSVIVVSPQTFAMAINPSSKGTAVSPHILADIDAPKPRANLMMTYDVESDVTIIFGGWSIQDPWENYDWWSYDYNADTFTNMTTASGPPRRSVSSLVYDSQSDRSVMFGGLQSFDSSIIAGDTWIYDYNINTWTNTAPSPSPTARDAHRMVYDSESDRIILFGGLGSYGGTYNITWAYDVNTNTWEEKSPSILPSTRWFHSMAYDAESDRIILFGGYHDEPGPGGTQEVVSDTWSYDYNTDTWENLNPATHPPARRGHAMTYDNESDRIVMFGGVNSTDIAIDDTWIYDYNSNTWVEAVNTTMPDGRLRHKMVYDYESDIIIMFGGILDDFESQNFVTYDLLWFYDTNSNTWTAGDSDRDGLLDSTEIAIGTDPFNNDTESDGMPDGWEVGYELDPLVDDSEGDPDSDLLENLDEFLNDANPQVDDTDSDGLIDGIEVLQLHTDPNNRDTDSDSMFDGWEADNGLDPLVDDADNDDDLDGLTNLQESHAGTNPQSADSDSDLMGDAWEITHGFDPLSAADAALDSDSDGLLNWQEFEAGSNPHMIDTDMDGYRDQWEVQFGFNPSDPVVPPMEHLVYLAPNIALFSIFIVVIVLGIRYKLKYDRLKSQVHVKIDDDEQQTAFDDLANGTGE